MLYNEDELAGASSMCTVVCSVVNQTDAGCGAVVSHLIVLANVDLETEN